MIGELLNERAQQLLFTLIGRYINDGQPVSSKTLAATHAISLSPASVRNVLADLEEKGLLQSLHTSSGRVPTAKGYRLFVNNLLTTKSLDAAITDDFKKALNPEQSVSTLVSTASSLLSRLTKMAGLVTVPKLEKISLTHVEFLPLSDKRVLVILVLSGKEIQNRIIHTEREFSRAELEKAANYLNNRFIGKSLERLRNELLTEMQQDRNQMDELMRSTIEVATNAFAQSQKNDYILAGEHNLLDLGSETNFARLRKLFDAFNEKREILNLLDKTVISQEIQIYIGGESGYEILDNCSLVTAPYHVDNNIVGALAVIGPSRMPYDKVISIVDMSSKLLSAALGHQDG
ncbi:MAG: heat-inducible transcriptional repressor HrcA [Gammaproteobacteria bacterium]